MAIRSIRVRVAAMGAALALATMGLVTPAVALGVRQKLSDDAKQLLSERMDLAEAAVAAGDLDAATRQGGSVVIQVVSERGEVLASSESVLSNTALVDHLDDDDWDNDRDDDDGRDDGDDDRDDDDGVEDDGRDNDRVEDDLNDDWDEAIEADDYDDTEDSDWDDDDWGDDDDASAASRTLSILRRTRPLVKSATKLGTSPELSAAATQLLRDELAIEGPYLLMSRELTAGDAGVTLLGLASLTASVEASAAALRLLGLASCAILAASALAAWLLTESALRPVEQLRSGASALVSSGTAGSLPVVDQELQELAHTLSDLLQRAEQALVEERRFVSDASHQLKSPVAAQRVMIETLRLHPDAIEGRATLDDLARENGHLQGIVEDLLTLARSDEGVRPKLAPTDLMDVVFETVASVSTSAAHTKIDTAGVEPVVAQCDARLMGQAIRNLLDNALRYARAVVAVECVERDGMIRIVVSDDGPGIPEADRERVFERFVRLEEGAAVHDGSTGLGLSVVRSILEGHGGSVHFEESHLGGAAAVIELPV